AGRHVINADSPILKTHGSSRTTSNAGCNNLSTCNRNTLGFGCYSTPGYLSNNFSRPLSVKVIRLSVKVIRPIRVIFHTTSSESQDGLAIYRDANTTVN